jgi:uncharacterized protein YicC (UPF0701 family)
MDLHARIPGSPVPRAESLLTMPGVMRQAPADPVQERETAAGPVQAGFAEALERLVAARAAEGARLAASCPGSSRRSPGCAIRPRRRPPINPPRTRCG